MVWEEGPFQATDTPPLCRCTMMTFFHGGNVPRNICSRWTGCQTTRLHQYTPFKTCGWLPVHYIDFPNRLHLNLTLFCPRSLVRQIEIMIFNHSGAIPGFGKGVANTTKNLLRPLHNATLRHPHLTRCHSQVCKPATAAVSFGPQCLYSSCSLYGDVLPPACLSQSSWSRLIPIFHSLPNMSTTSRQPCVPPPRSLHPVHKSFTGLASLLSRNPDAQILDSSSPITV